jgi:3-oxoadipate enol-lactonase
MPFAIVGGSRLYYEVRGSGPRVLFIGGTGGDLRRPPHALDRLLQERFETLFFDQRGMGRSDKPDAPCTMADYADDAAGLLDALGWPHCALLGYSFGGMVAQELALRHPARPDRLVLVSTTSGGAGGSSYPMHELAALEPEVRARRFVELADTRRDAAWQAANPALWEQLLADSLASIRLAAEDAAARSGAARQLEARRHHDTWARLPALALPAAVFGGKYDGIAPPRHQEALAGRIAGARFELFEGGHLFFLQDLRALSAIETALAGASS